MSSLVYMSTSEDRRSNPRFKVSMDAGVLLIGANQGFKARVRDVSETGARIVVHGEPPPTHPGATAVLDLIDRPINTTVVRQVDGTLALRFAEPLPRVDLDRIASTGLDPSPKVEASPLTTVLQRSFVSPGTGLELHVAVLPQEFAISNDEGPGEYLDLPDTDCLTGDSYLDLQRRSTVAAGLPHAPWELGLIASVGHGPEKRIWSLASEPHAAFVGGSMLLLCNPKCASASSDLVNVLGSSGQLRAHGFDPGHVRLAIAVALAARRPDVEAVHFLKDIESWEIPVAQSPGLRGIPLGNLIQHMAIATLAITEGPAVEHLSRGEFILALQFTLTGSLMTALFAGTLIGISAAITRIANRSAASGSLRGQRRPPRRDAGKRSHKVE
jgi:hypothetical protein